MITKADDYPIHQTAEPIAVAGTDRNFYDRYFFNGYDADGGLFFAAALGVYPHLNIMDAAFCVRRAGKQTNLRASRVMHGERLDTAVGPIRIEVLAPLRRLRLGVDSPEHGLHADLTFHARTEPIEEPRFTHRQGTRTFLDCTRLTQNGAYEGHIDVEGRREDLRPDRILGTRDRSWGVRPVGAPDGQPVVPFALPQFYWLWAPLNFPDAATLFHLNADAEGNAWNTRGVIAPIGDGAPREYRDVACETEYVAGTRRVRRATIHYRRDGNDEARVVVEPQFAFYMSGLGYTHPDWGHGHYKGDLAVGCDHYDLASIDDAQPAQMHIQAFSRAQLERADGTRSTGVGVVEQLFVGPHAPSGFRELFDPAP